MKFIKIREVNYNNNHTIDLTDTKDSEEHDQEKDKLIKKIGEFTMDLDWLKHK